jgi:hypothetical protein
MSGTPHHQQRQNAFAPDRLCGEIDQLGFPCCPEIANGKSFGEWIIRIKDVVREPINPSLPAYRWTVREYCVDSA